ncbi:hypothetical protein ABZ519_23945 [Streptomyces collinus]
MTDAVRHAVESVGRGGGADRGLHQGAQFVPQAGDGRLLLLQLLGSRC